MNIEIFIRILILIIALSFFGISVYFAFMDNFKALVAFLTMGMLCLILALLSRFKRFKGFGFEAELWESKQEEAAEIIVMLRSLAVTISRQILTLSARAGRIASATPRDELFALKENIDNILINANVSAEERESVASEFYKYTAIDMIHAIFDKINLKIGSKKIENTEARNKIRSDLKTAINMSSEAGVSNFILNLIDNYDFLNGDEKSMLKGEIHDELEDLREWIAKRGLRRRAVWFSKDPMKV